MRIWDNTFMVVSLLGFMICVVFTASGRFGEVGTFGFKLGFALTFFFTLLIISAMVSILPEDERKVMKSERILVKKELK